MDDGEPGHGSHRVLGGVVEERCPRRLPESDALGSALVGYLELYDRGAGDIVPACERGISKILLDPSANFLKSYIDARSVRDSIDNDLGSSRVRRHRSEIIGPEVSGRAECREESDPRKPIRQRTLSHGFARMVMPMTK